MEILLEEFYKQEIHLERYYDRKSFLDNKSYQICGITQSGKTKLVKSYLLSLKKNSYLYIDCSDERIDIDELNQILNHFCIKNHIDILVLDNYKEEIKFPNVSQLLIISQKEYKIDFLETLWLYPLDYEEFLAHEHKFDSTVLNHYLQLGGLTCMHYLLAEERAVFIQQKLKTSLSEIEFEILKFVSKTNSSYLSAFMIYERLKQKRKISKDKIYQNYKTLIEKKYLFEVQKYNHPKASKKLYLADIFFKTALSVDKHFGRLFENMIYLELVKHNKTPYYFDEVDFYLFENDEVILAKPFADERSLFKKLEKIESFIFSYKIKKITAVTMSKEAIISHPLSKVEMIPFNIWALSDLG